MQSDISNDEAIHIAVDWLKANNLLARLSVQKPLLDQSVGCWQIAIYINDSEESNQVVGQLSIDAKTGKITDHTPTESIIQRTIESDFDAEVLSAARRFMDKHNKLLSRLAQ